MPILKKINANTFYRAYFNGTGTMHIPFYQNYGETYNTSLIEDEAQSVLYIDGKAHESTSLVPFFDKKPEVFNPSKANLMNWYSSENMYTKYGYANAMHQNSSTTTTTAYTAYDSQVATSFTKAADLTETLNDSLIKQVDISGTKVNFYLTKKWNESLDTSTYKSFDQTLVMYLGDDMTDASSLVEYTLPIDASGFTANSNTKPTLTFLHIDTTNRYIYFLSHNRRSYSSQAYIHECIYMVKFNLPSQDGSFSFGTLTRLYLRPVADNVTVSGTTNEIEEGIISFCGIDAFNNLIFCEQYNRWGTSAPTYPKVANKYVTTFIVVSTTSTPTVARTYEVQGTWSLADSWNPGYSPVGIARPTKFISDSTTATLKRALLPLPVSNTTYGVGYALITWDSSLNASLGTTQPFTISAISQANTDPVGSYFDIDLRFTPKPAFIWYQWFQKPIITNLNGEIFLTLFTSFKNYLMLDEAMKSNSKKANMICYKVLDLETNPTLQFVNSLPFEALDYITTDNNSTLNVIDKDGLSFYSLSPNGWVLTNKESGVFTSMTFDSFGRLWALKTAARDLTQWETPVIYQGTSFKIHDPKLELYIIPRTSAYTTSIEFTDTDVEYNGVNINNTLKVNAYNALGQRIATTVLLSIEGPNMEFQAGGTQLQVTTSTIQDTSVPVVITGPGYVNVTASFVI